MQSCLPTARIICSRLATAGFVLIAVGYPVLVYLGLKSLAPKTVAFALGTLLLVRFLAGLHSGGGLRLGALLLPPLALCAAAAYANRPEFILYLPVFTALAMLASFGFTLFRGPSAVEAIARVRKPVMSAEEIAYCRRVTEIWVGFFVLNGAIGLGTIHWGSMEAWAFYNGFLAYVLMGLLFAVEFVYRHWRFRRYVGLPTDPLFRRLFPPRI